MKWRGFLTVALLMTGSLLLMALGGFAALVLAQPNKPAVAASAESDPDKKPGILGAAGVGAAAGLAKPVATVSKMVPGSVAGKVGLIVRQNVGGQVGRTVSSVVAPVVGGAVGGSQQVLPSFLAQQVGWAATYSGHAAETGARVAAERAINGTSDAAPLGLPQSLPKASAVGASPAVVAAVTASPQDDQGGAAILAPEGAWTIELARFAAAFNAERFGAELLRQGVDSRVAIDDTGGRRFFAVRTAVYARAEEAQAAQTFLSGRGYEGSVIRESGGANVP